MAEKRRRGRPSKFDKAFIDQARKFCLLGATNVDLGRMFEVDTKTIDRWLAEKPEFRRAVKAGREEADAHVADRLFARATGYSHPAVKIMAVDKVVERHEYTEHYPPDTAAAFIWLKNRQPQRWRDKVEVDNRLVDGEGNAVDILSAAQRIAFLLAMGVQQAEQEPEPLH
jgi:hypothetical protein